MQAQDAGFRRTFTRTTSETPSLNPNDPTTMALVNENYLKLTAGYLFPEIARRVSAFAAAHPEVAARIIRCGIGDVTEPLPSAVIA